MINFFLTTRIFPDEQRLGGVKPVFIGGNNEEFSNYRGISVLPIFSKVLE